MEEVKIINPLKGQSDNGWHFEQQVYDAEGIARAVKAGEGSGNIPKVIEIGRVKEGKHQQDLVQHEEGICRCICTGTHASTPHLLKTMVSEPISVAMRGRNPNNPSERGKSNGNYKQRLEMNESGVANTITSVQKDCLVAEPRVIQVGNIYPDTDKFKTRTIGRVYEAEGIAPTINTCGGGGREPLVLIGEITSDNLLELVQAGLVRIRKITPREAFRLMDIEEEYIDVLMSCGVANTGMYQLAGNSIVVGCLYHIFRKMFIETQNENQQLTLF